MAPKKSKKISLNEFLGDSTLGSWADEMDALPNAPAGRNDEEYGQRFGRKDDFSSTRPDRLIREDVVLPSQPPYTAFIGNLAFDLTDTELAEFFSSSKVKSVKIIKDKDDKPKGFGYVEYEDLEGLKDGLTKTGSSFSGRVIRVSVAEPPKERIVYGAPSEDSKFDNPWRREGPLPTRDSSRRPYDTHPGERHPARITEETGDWRSSRPSRTLESETPSFKRKGTGFTPDGQVNADKEDTWLIGGKFRPSPDGSHDEVAGRFSSVRAKGDMGPPKEISSDEPDWRIARSRPRGSVSPNNSMPPTPQLARKKLELLPRTGNTSVTTSPLSSPKMGPMPTSNISRPNPFGGAKPVDVSSREKEVTDRLERDKEAQGEKLAMSRTSSHTGVERNSNRVQTPPLQSKSASQRSFGPNLAATVRPSLSFANVAAKKDQDVDHDSTSPVSRDKVEL